MNKTNRTIAALSCLTLSAVAASGQSTPGAPEFEVATVKPAPQDGGRPMSLPTHVAEMMAFSGGPGSKDPGRIDYSRVTLKMLLARAYNLKPDQIQGPDWTGTERYTIAAKLPPGTDMDRLRLMLQNLLTERFKITLHREVKQLAVYRLKVAKNGPKLQPPQKLPDYKDEEEKKAAMQASARARMDAMMKRMQEGRSGPSRNFSLASATTAKFAEVLSGHLDRPVKDMTELEGLYSFSLSWTPDNSRPAGSAIPDEPSGTSVFTAIQEQLGLKLEAGKESFEVLVIDKADKLPISN